MKDLERMNVNDIKSLLKNVGMIQSGDKGTLIYRFRIYEKCVARDIKVDGNNPCNLNIKDLKKYAAQRGVNVIGTQDEILDAFVKILVESTPFEKADNNENEQQSGASNAVVIARRIIHLDEADDFEGILNLAQLPSMPQITRKTEASVMRKAYLKLSLLIHPDKLERSFSQATKAFQALVRAFDFLTSEDIHLNADDAAAGSSSSSRRGSSKDHTRTIARSNEGCFRTRICCPRCKQPWSEGGLDGNPPYVYNFMMQGLQKYTCSTCLCHFGAMTAVHKCPFCSRVYEYSIKDYHHKVTCSNKKCGKTFGFMLFPASDRAMAELRVTIRQQQDSFLKAREAKLRRARMGAKRDDSFQGEQAEKAFLLGLIDCCPRCGEDFCGYPDENLQRVHLMECADETKHAQHKRSVAEKKKKEEAKTARVSAEEAALAQAAWSFLGGKSSQLYLLNDSQLRERAADLQIDGTGSREQVIERLARVDSRRERGGDDESEDGDARAEMQQLTSSSSSSSSRKREIFGSSAVVKSKKCRMSADSLPSDLHSLGVDQLRAICASNGLFGLLPPRESSTKQDILEILEAHIFD